MSYFATRKDEEGLSINDREQLRQKRLWEEMDKRNEAQLQRDMDCIGLECFHYPECPAEQCRDVIEAKTRAEDQYQKTIAKIDAEYAAPSIKPKPPCGPTSLKSKAAATVLSQPKNSLTSSKTTSKQNPPSTKARLNTSLASHPKKAPMPSNPSSMRHAAAVANSRTTVGYAKGRSTSATLRKTVLPKKDSRTPDTSLAPTEYIQRYGTPAEGSEMWFECKRAGCFDKDKGPNLEEMFAGDGTGAFDTLLREEAEEDFQLILEA